MRFLLLAYVLVFAALPVDASPYLHGYGSHDCERFLNTLARAEDGEARGILDYVGYEQWFAGLASGLSMATGEDVLRGADVGGMMRRVSDACWDDRALDVFDAANDYLKNLSALR